MTMGHNSIAGDQLKSLIGRVERLEEEKSALARDIREVYGEAKGSGLDVKIMRKIVRIRKQEKAAWREEESLTDLYLQAMGWLD